MSLSKFPRFVRKDSSRIGLGPTKDLIFIQFFFICNDYLQIGSHSEALGVGLQHMNLGAHNFTTAGRGTAVPFVEMVPVRSRQCGGGEGKEGGFVSHVMFAMSLGQQAGLDVW